MEELDASRLRVGGRYAVGGVGIPLMPALSFANYEPLTGPMRRLGTGDEFIVIRVERRRRGDAMPWYQVRVETGKQAGREGWLNSVALLPAGVRSA